MELKTYFAQDRNGNLIPSANVSIYLTGTTTLASGLTTVSGTALANPFTADADGKIQFRAPDGIYDMQVALGSTTGVKVTFQCVDIEQQLADADSAADRAEAAAESIEGQATIIAANTREQWWRILADAGLNLVPGSFEEGATVSTVTDAVWHQEGGQCYTWGGTFPKAVPSGSSPGSTGGVAADAWVSTSSAILRSQLAADGGSLLVAHKTTIAGGVRRALQNRLMDIKSGKDFGMVSGGNSADGLQAALNVGGVAYIPRGQYTIDKPVVVDFSEATNPGFPFLGRNSRRIGIIGEGLAHTTLNFDGSSVATCLSLTGDLNYTGQGSEPGAEISNMTIFGTGNTGVGLRLTGSQGLHVHDIQILRANIGLRLSNVLSSRLERLNLRLNNIGLYMDSNETGGQNAMHISGTIGSCTQRAIEGFVGTNCHYKGGNLEHNGTQGDAGTGAVYLQVKEPMAVLSFEDYYIGNNRGGEDIRIKNISNGTIIVHIKKCMITRGAPDGGYTERNILIENTGTGKTILILDGVNFFTNQSWGYVPSASRPFISVDASTKIIGMDTCSFNETISLSSARSSSQVFSGTVRADGTYDLPQGWTASKVTTGKYAVNAPFDLGATINDYYINATSQSVASPQKFVGQVEKVSTTSFRVYTYLQSTPGTAADGEFSFMVSRSR